MLILISSGAQPRYADDIVRALAHPAGTTFQFRYGTKYVEDRLGQRDLANEPALVCYLMVDASAKTVRLIPCRFATVANGPRHNPATRLESEHGRFSAGATTGRTPAWPRRSARRWISLPRGSFE